MPTPLPPKVAAAFRAVLEADRESLERALSEDREVLRACDESGRSLSLVAVYTGQAALAWDLVRRGAPEGVHEAAALGDLPRLRELLGKDPEGAKTFAPDGWTPLHLAAFFGNLDACALLLDHGAELSAKARNPLANEPLHAAVAGGHASAVRLLIERGADPRSPHCQRGSTPLHLAVESDDAEIVEVLLEAGAEVGAHNDQGQTPVDVARLTGHDTLVPRMLRQGALDLGLDRRGRSRSTKT